MPILTGPAVRGISETVHMQGPIIHTEIKLLFQAIEDQIKQSKKLIEDAEDLSSVQEEFKHDPIYLAKVNTLASKYSRIRRTRPDGNCFFRAIAFAYFEKVKKMEINNNPCSVVLYIIISHRS